MTPVQLYVDIVQYGLSTVIGVSTVLIISLMCVHAIAYVAKALSNKK